ncbi:MULTISPECIES: acyl-CoA dehydrogenase family protein [unclassified Thermosynechococcus]|uniref:acyl-CoA dehydrogenase family protein n=1 Tax=unclassified Thermosynechococcus TaxID=2622553 RepID=UPI0019F11C1F|nr:MULTISPECIES: acyl-CoA dehydrogenase family protein [unclassified Thermosynechococcus]HIK34329.1 acyl-CoA/acyl-ACP dehydrogenase [Thermosynechococcus sp. M98_K2018_005]HIK48007.1 acyl-CoA/acyl-ACP dehydrogenase [Thermosynechococcus sp. M55_K2018_012]
MDALVFADPAAQPLLKDIQTYLSTVVAPIANRIDQQKSPLSESLQALGNLDIFRLAVPKAMGGLGCDRRTLWHLSLQLAQTSGALAFLVAQHQSALGIILEHPEGNVGQTYLADLMKGQMLIGVSFSHLRHNPVDLQAQPTSGGYLLRGTLPWLSGFQHMTMFVAAAPLPNGRILFALMPFINAQQAGGGILHLSLPLPLAAVPSTQTVQAEVVNWLVPPEDVVGISEADWMVVRDRQQLLRGSAAPMGCARASLQILAESPDAKDLYHHLRDRWHRLYDHIQEELENLNPPYHAQLRAAAIHLAVQAAQAALMTTGGSALMLSHTVQRLYREAMLYTVSGLNAPVRHALMEDLLLEKGSP